MDATTFRWVLVIIAIILAVAIYIFGQHQARLRKRNALETFTREEVDSAFIEDEQLRFELNNLNNILRDNESGEALDDIQINPAQEARKPRYALPDPEIFVPAALAGKDGERLISYHLRHGDFRVADGLHRGPGAGPACPRRKRLPRGPRWTVLKGPAAECWLPDRVESGGGSAIVCDGRAGS